MKRIAASLKYGKGTKVIVTNNILSKLYGKYATIVTHLWDEPMSSIYLVEIDNGTSYRLRSHEFKLMSKLEQVLE